jgi:hypothetical protein
MRIFSRQPKPSRGQVGRPSYRGKQPDDDGVVGGLAGKALAATHVDSWENGAQNWTEQMRKEFQSRRGYDLLPYLPTLTGRVVQSQEISERFLWDLRKTVSELVVENYAGRLRELAHEHGLRFTIEAYGSPCDFLPYAGQCDEPMGEFWVGGGALETCKGMASAGHVYGKRIIGAESFTAADQERWLAHPATIKSLGDRAFCEGINRFVVHRYAMQPWLDREPGMTMGPWGVHYERTQTWWELTPQWHRYLARCQFLLRQGLFVADICYLDSEGSPHGFQDRRRQGYDWDQCSPEVVLTRMNVKDGRLVLPDGMSYRVLVLPEERAMTAPLLRRIKELVAAGATVVGPRPLRSPSLTGYPQCRRHAQRVAAVAQRRQAQPDRSPHVYHLATMEERLGAVGVGTVGTGCGSMDRWQGNRSRAIIVGCVKRTVNEWLVVRGWWLVKRENAPCPFSRRACTAPAVLVHESLTTSCWPLLSRCVLCTLRAVTGLSSDDNIAFSRCLDYAGQSRHENRWIAMPGITLTRSPP